MRNLFLIGGALLLAAAIAAFLLLHQRNALQSPGTAPNAVTAAPQAPPTAPPAATDCLLPGPPPVMPDGRIATAADMKAAHDRIRGFVEQLEAYQTCRDEQHDFAGPTISATQRQTWLDQGDAAIDEATAMAKEYARQLNVFKARPHQ